MIFADINDNGNQFRHFLPDLGQIESFDQYVVLLRNTVTQMVYKHAISTVVPARAVNLNADSESE